MKQLCLEPGSESTELLPSRFKKKKSKRQKQLNEKINLSSLITALPHNQRQITPSYDL